MNTQLEASDLQCVRGERRLFDSLSFSLGAGSALRIEGANGSGKTSLLRMLCGSIRPAAGEIRWNDRPIDRLGEIYRRAFFYLGHQNALKEELDGIENLRFGAALHDIPLSDDDALEALEKFGLGNRARLPVRLLSQGQKRRVALAALNFRSACPLWLLDEAFVALDAEAIGSVAQLIDRHLDRGGIVVYTTHQDVALQAAQQSSVRLA